MSISVIRPPATMNPPIANSFPCGRDDVAGGAVDDRRPSPRGETAEEDRARGDLLAPRTSTRRVRAARACRRGGRRPGRGRRSGPRSRRRGTRRGRRRRPALLGQVDAGSGCAPWTRRRARLASWRAASGVRSMISAISSNGTANMSWRTKASRSAGVKRLEHDQQREPDRVGEERFLLRVGVPSRADDRLGHPGARPSPRAASARARSRSRQTRPTTVVSQPPRLSIAARRRG